MRKFGMFVSAVCLLVMSCSKEKSLQNNVQPPAEISTQPADGPITEATVSLGIVGDPADVTRTTEGGTVLMGGGTDVDAAIQWMIQRSGGGDFVVLRATGTDAYNSYIYGLGTVNSVETILIDSRTVANDPAIETKIRNAEALFIAGGDQANYYNYWEGTRVETAINYLRNTKKVPIGGTSAGCAIQGKIYFTAVNGTITSAAALANPFNSKLTLQRDNFISNPYLDNLITDTHFNNPDRRGRLITFMARMSKDYAIVPKGVGVDEQTAVCIDKNGFAKVYGIGTAFFLRQNTASGVPERCVSGSSLDWYRARQAIRAYKINGSTTGSGNFDMVNWSGTGGTAQFYYIDRGVLGIF
jgi:cyanophycinase-like exopeptidase